jgi:hypothetical protein
MAAHFVGMWCISTLSSTHALQTLIFSSQRLMYERAAGEDSTIKPYIDMLPTKLDTPLFWPEDSRNRLLQGCLITQDTRSLSDKIQGQYQMMNDLVFLNFPELFEPTYFSLDSYRLAVALSISRAFSLEGLQGPFG